MRIKRVMRLGSICYVSAIGHRKYIKQFIVAGTWILNKLIIIMLCFFLSACNSATESRTSVKHVGRIEYSLLNEVDTYTFKYSNEANLKSIEILYAECENGVLIEKESYVFEIDDNDILNLSISERDIDIYYNAGNEHEKHIQFLLSLDSVDDRKISYKLIQDKDLVSGDILLYLDAKDMTSVQSEVDEDWTKFEGTKARAVVLRFAK